MSRGFLKPLALALLNSVRAGMIIADEMAIKIARFVFGVMEKTGSK
jgi:hypothetical protein